MWTPRLSTVILFYHIPSDTGAMFLFHVVHYVLLPKLALAPGNAETTPVCFSIRCCLMNTVVQIGDGGSVVFQWLHLVQYRRSKAFITLEDID